MRLHVLAWLCTLCYTKTTLKGLILAGFVNVTISSKEFAESRFSVRLRRYSSQRDEFHHHGKHIPARAPVGGAVPNFLPPKRRTTNVFVFMNWGTYN